MFEILRRLFWGAYFHKIICFRVHEKHTLFPVGRIVTRLPIIVWSSSPNFLLRYAPDCTFPPPTPSPRSVATLPRAWSLRSLCKDCAPPPNAAHYATACANIDDRKRATRYHVLILMTAKSYPVQRHVPVTFNMGRPPPPPGGGPGRTGSVRLQLHHTRGGSRGVATGVLGGTCPCPLGARPHTHTQKSCIHIFLFANIAHV